MQLDNIYKIAREMRGLTQEEAAFRIGKSWRSISNYETFNTIPSEKVVIKMVEVYNARWLAYMHFKCSTELGEKYFPDIDLRDLPRAVLKVQKEMADFIKIAPDMIEIACDGVIDEHEKNTWDKVRLEASDLAGAIMAIIFSMEISNVI